MAYTIGIDYGTNSVRAIIVDVLNGQDIAACVYNYPTGQQGVIVDARDHNLARQNPSDYIIGLETTVKGALEQAVAVDGFTADQVIGLGVDTTGSTPIPVDKMNVPLALNPKFKDKPAANAWLWKDHTSQAEAEQITKLAAKERPEYIAKCGMTYSSEWFWAKILHCLNTDPDVFDAAYSWVELSDFVPALLAGVSDPKAIMRNVCAAGHKALYCDEWDGLPDKAFLSMLNPKLADLRDRLYERAYDASVPAGQLCSEWADRLGLREGIPVAMGEMDVHYGAIGSGIDEGVLVKAIGTSTCDCCVVKADKKVEDIPGICGIVKGAILPGYYGVEAGQSAVGDIFKWFIEYFCKGDDAMYASFADEAAAQKPGQSGLLALDWNNGNRTILVDFGLTGLLLGQTLHTTPAEVYRALIEGTAFGARMIIERIKEYGVPVSRVVCCGGIAEKNPLLMQIYADVTGCTMQVSKSSQSCALGAALSAAVMAGPDAGGYATFSDAQAKMTGVKALQYTPDPTNQVVYEELFALYRQLHDAFGGVTNSSDLSGVMKELLSIKARQNK